MYRKRISILLALSLALSLLAGCGGSGESTRTETAASDTTAEAASASPADTTDSAAAAEEAETLIVFDGDEFQVTGTGVEPDEDGDLKIVDGGTYRITGVSDAGRVVVAAADTADVTVILDGCDLFCADDEALYVKVARSARIVLAEGTENYLTSGYEPAEEDALDEEASGAALRFKCPAVITGSGSLTVRGYINNGIASTGDLTIESGEIEVTAVNNGVKSKTDLTISGGSLSVTSDMDGLQADGTLTINDGTLDVHTGAGAYGADMKVSDSLMMGNMGGGRDRDRSASGEASGETEESEDASVEISDTASGEADAEEAVPDSAGGEQRASREMPAPGMGWDMDDDNTGSRKALKAGTAIEIHGGTVTLDAEDDALHTDGTVLIDGGEITALSGDDGVHGGESLLIEGGSTNIYYCYEGLEASAVTITGGYVNVIATDDGMNVNGGSGMGGPSREASGETGDAEEQTPILRITGGIVLVDSGGDGLDSNGSTYIEGGEVYVSGPSSDWDAAIDYGEGSSELVISGGTVMAGGYSGMAEVPDDAENAQPSIYYSMSGYAPDGALCTLSDAHGNVIAAYAFAHSYNCVVISSPDITVGETYTLTMGDLTAEIEMTDTNYSNRFRGGMGGPSRDMASGEQDSAGGEA